VTLTATVTAASGIAAGTVTFRPGFEGRLFPDELERRGRSNSSCAASAVRHESFFRVSCSIALPLGSNHSVHSNVPSTDASRSASGTGLWK
jgi:hypothetical protein